MSTEREALNLSMKTMDLLLAMSEGNPGAGTVLPQILGRIDGIMLILSLDDMNIRGSQIWIGYKDYCHNDIEKFIASIKLRDPEMVRTINDEMLRSDQDNKEFAVNHGASFEHNSPRKLEA